ncbi:MAG: asparagine synthetase B family protein [bacterium]
MKGIFSHRPLIPLSIRAEGYSVFSPHLWMDRDPFARHQEYVEGEDGRQYCIFIRGDSSEQAVGPVKGFIAGDAEALSSLRGRWLAVVYGESPMEEIPPSITIITDRLGSNRVYYMYDGEILAWSSSLADLLVFMRNDEREYRLDARGLNGYLGFLHQPSPSTLVGGIAILPPASCMTLTEGKATIQRYWSPTFAPPFGSGKGAAAEIRRLLNDAGRRLASWDGRAGILLSGGLDSSLIAGMGKARGKDLIAYTVGFEGVDDERRDARRVAHHYKVRHREVLLRPGDIPELLWEVTRCLGFPAGNPSGLATFAVARQAGKEVGRMLSGLGSDELFGGHTKHILARSWTCGHKVVSLLRRCLSPFGNSEGCLSGRPVSLDRYADLYTFFDREQREMLLLPAYRTRDDGYYMELLRDSFHEEQFLTDVYAWLADDLLPLASSLCAHFDLWLDLPLCNDEMLACAARIPLSMKVRGGQGKRVLREACRDVVPAWVFKKGRRGFTLPMGAWLRGPLKDLLDDYLAPDVIEKRGIFRPGEVGKMIKAHTEGKADLSLQLWGLITLEVWQRIFIDTEKPENPQNT